MPTAEIISIGTELLLGEIQDTNTRYLARVLRDAGVDLYRTMIVGDNPGRISQSIQEAMARSEIIITTGGLGPTVDDPTRQAVAQALGVDLDYRPDLWEQIQARFQRYGRQATENNKRQAYIPRGAAAVENPVGTAPAFIFEKDGSVIASLPGVPREMEYLVQNAVLPFLRQRFKLQGTIKACVLHTASMGESQIDELIGDLEILGNPTVGLLAHPGQIDIRVTAKARSVEEADELIGNLAGEVRRRLGNNIYGADEETLGSAVQTQLERLGYSLAVVESGLESQLLKLIPMERACFRGGELVPEPLEMAALTQRTLVFQEMHGSDVALGAALHPKRDRQELLLVLAIPGVEEQVRSWGGPPQMAPLWAANVGLDWIRRSLAVIP